MSLVVKNLACGYGDRVVISNINLVVEAGEIVCILGPNGVGKTTFFKTIQGFLSPKDGEVLLDGEAIRAWDKKRLARALAYVPQTHSPPFPYKVRDVVVMGRTAHLNMFSVPGKEDYRLGEEIMEKLGIAHLVNKIYSQISGGERQMVLIARALVQQPKLLMMDEPTSNLDFGNQVKVLQQIINLSRENIGIIMTTHFPDHAFLCSTKVALFERDNRFTYGTAEEVVTEESLKAAYSVNVKMTEVENRHGVKLKICTPMLD
ncbi:MAG: ABC transporter ATP-binding protein [Desulfosporosinus sp.]|nr:ABC transporter ATP-binding protein [Desulfosporosinus sp.]